MVLNIITIPVHLKVLPLFHLRCYREVTFKVSYIEQSFLSLVPEAAAAAYPGNLLEMQIFRPYLTIRTQKLWGWAQPSMVHQALQLMWMHALFENRWSMFKSTGSAARLHGFLAKTPLTPSRGVL